PNSAFASQFRFAVLLEKARGAVNSVLQFGTSLQGILDRRDSENMTLLLQTQQQQVLAMTQEIQNNNIAVLQDGLMALQSSLKGAQTRLAHYSNLYSNWISSSEQTAMDLRTAAAALNISAQPLHTTAAGLDMVPNIFGFACGGTKYGAAATAVGIGLQIGAMANDLSAQRLDISEQYRRRREDWQIQRDNAESEVAQLEAQIQSQTQQIAMAQKQLALAKQELANQQAVYDLQTTRFTGLELFNWMTGRLSSLYYQLYDVTLSLCLSCKAALAREIGADRAGNLFVTPMWNDLYQGLLAGEGLLLELQRMENTYLKDDKRGLEILKTVSLNAQISKGDSSASFGSLLNTVLAGGSPAAQGGVQMEMSGQDKLVIKLELDTLGLLSAYGSNEKVGRLKNISVTLPALLGPYQDVEATLALGATYVALSRGLDDSGVFVVDFNDPKYLPFEGEPIDGVLNLTFFHAGVAGAQRALVESLVDVIYQIRYTLKDY
ncbi:insecticidal toxin complex protein, partial [Pseudomonas resinovorans]|nr:insecticidal toxin complex protein [Pseudomonas resinovorans]